MASIRRLLCTGLVVLVLHPAAAPAWAETRTPPQATQHALAELANCRAQRRPECPTETPTPTLTATATPIASPTSTSTPEPTDEPTPSPPATPGPASCWLTDQDLGDPNSGYVVFDEAGAPVPCPTSEPSDVPAEEPTAT